MIVSLMIGAVLGEVSAHQIPGLPHYEGAMSRPTYTDSRIVGGWKLTFSYVAIPAATSCEFLVAIENTTTKELFSHPVYVTMFREQSDPSDGRSFVMMADPTEMLRVDFNDQESGVYVVRVAFDDGRQYVEDFRMPIGTIGVHPLWVIIPIGIILLLVGLNLWKRCHAS
jgi:hypothetical protein